MKHVDKDLSECADDDLLKRPDEDLSECADDDLLKCADEDLSECANDDLLKRGGDLLECDFQPGGMDGTILFGVGRSYLEWRSR